MNENLYKTPEADVSKNGKIDVPEEIAKKIKNGMDSRNNFRSNDSRYNATCH